MFLFVCLFLCRDVVLDDGLRLYCEVEGSGPPLLLIAGLGNRLESWTAIRQGLAEDFTVVVYDHRGLGRSGDVEGPYSVQTMADEALQLMTHLGFERFHVAGISLGSLVAQQLAFSHPDRILKLVLIASTAGGPQHVNPHAEVIAYLARSGSLSWAERIEQGIEFSLHPDYLEREKDRVAAWLETIKHNPVPDATIQRQTLAGMFFVGAGVLPKIETPTLVLHGEDDRIVPVENGRKVAALLPNARLVILPQSGHICILDQTERVVEEMRSFLSSADAPH